MFQVLNYSKGKQFGGKELQAFLCLFYVLLLFAPSFSADAKKSRDYLHKRANWRLTKFDYILNVRSLTLSEKDLMSNGHTNSNRTIILVGHIDCNISPAIKHTSGNPLVLHIKVMGNTSQPVTTIFWWLFCFGGSSTKSEKITLMMSSGFESTHFLLETL